VAFWPRAGAAVIDFFVRLAIVLAASVIGALGYVADADTGEAFVNIAGIIGFVAALSYAPLMIARTGGPTVGHRAVDTRIVRRDGSPLTAGAAGVREVLVKGVLFEGLAVFLVFIPTVLNYLWPLWDADNETLHDKVCSTRVVDA
jgi:uncharacterized RDD family membrane protein YckC